MIATAAARTAPPTAAAPRAAAMPDAENMLLVRMRETADLSQEAQLPRGAERRAAVWNDLNATAERTQAPVHALLDELQSSGAVVDRRTIPIANALSVTVAPGKQQAVIDALKGVDQVGSVLANEGKFGTSPVPATTNDATVGARTLAAPFGAAAPDAAPPIEWGVARIGAPKVWERGITGAGVTVGIMDSGVDTKHAALRSAYRGTQADGSQQHDYNWIDLAGFQGARFQPTPNDDLVGHGTHVAGSVLGAEPGRASGVAPGAKFVAARMVFEDSLHSTISALDGLQFMLAPTKVDGTAPDPSRGVDVVNNSWGHGAWESHETQGAFDALKAAGILLVNSAGNDGRRGAGTVTAPGAYPGHLSVAASTQADRVALFSSQGPSSFGGGVGDTPTITAPGAGIVSARPGGGYRSMDGTSMAAPHVAGAVALLLEAKPQATFEEIHAALTATANDIDARGADHKSGHGRIDVDAAVEALLKK